MTGRPWYAFYPEDYRRRAGHLNFIQDAAYRRLLDQYYQRETPLPVDLPAVHRLVGAVTRQEQQAISAVLTEFFVLQNDGWHNQRADEELAAASEICKARSKSAKTAAAKRWDSHAQRNASRNANADASRNASRITDAKQNDAHLQLQEHTQPSEPYGSKGIPEDKSSGSVTAANGHDSKPAWWPERDRYGRITSEITDKIMFDVAKAVLGSGCGGVITRFRKTARGDMRTITEFLLQANEKSNPREWFGGVLKRAELDEMPNPPHQIYPVSEYRS